MTVAKLVSESKDGSAAAQQCLFERLAPGAKLICLRYIKNNEDAEEVMLDGFYKFFTGLPTFRYSSDAAVIMFLRKIMVNECLMQLRKINSFTLLADSMISDTVAQDNVLDTLETREIFELILQLPVGYRTIFNLFAVEGYEHREIAAALGITESTSRSQLTRARTLLQKMLPLNKKSHEKHYSK